VQVIAAPAKSGKDALACDSIPKQIPRVFTWLDRALLLLFFDLLLELAKEAIESFAALPGFPLSSLEIVLCGGALLAGALDNVIEDVRLVLLDLAFSKRGLVREDPLAGHVDVKCAFAFRAGDSDDCFHGVLLRDC
jgi:hypothetical protein